MRPEGEREGGEGSAAPGWWGDGVSGEEGCGGLRQISRGRGLRARGRTHTGLTRLPLSFLHPPNRRRERGWRELGLTKNNNEITITKANTGARARSPRTRGK